MSCVVVMPSRSGKGQAIKVIENLAEMLQIRYKTEGVITDAGLIGTVRINKKREEDIIYGDLYNYDLLLVPEANQIFKKRQYKEEILDILQNALDTTVITETDLIGKRKISSFGGRIDKKLASEKEISYTTNISFMFFTYFLEEFRQVLLEQGIFQRTIVYIENFDAEKRALLNDIIVDNLEVKDLEKYYGLLTDIATELKLISIKNKAFTAIRFDNYALDTIKRIIQTYTRRITGNFKGRDLELILPFTTSMIEFLVKISGTIALLESSQVISNMHVGRARFVVDMCFSSLLGELLMKASKKQETYEVLEQRIIGLLANLPKPISKEEFYKLCMQRCGVRNRNKIVMVVKKMIANKQLKIDKILQGRGSPFQMVSLS